MSYRESNLLKSHRLLLPGTLTLLGALAGIQIFAPERVHELANRPLGVILLGGTFLWARVLKEAKTAYETAEAELMVRERAEEELARTEERLRLAQTFTNVGAWDHDVPTNTSTWSQSLRDLYGVGPDTPSTYPAFLALVHEDDRRRVDDTVERVLGLGGSFEFEFRLRRPDGEIRWLHSRGHVLLDSHGAPTRMLGLTMDISQRKHAEVENEKLEEKLRQSQKLEAVGRLAGGVAHDFNNLLLGIRGYTELALMNLESGASPREHLVELGAAVERGTALTKQLLAFSRKQVLTPEILDLNDVVASTESLLRRLIGADVELATVHADAPVRVDADRGQLEQVIVNLAVNARDAMPDGGRLTFEVGPVEVGTQNAGGLEPGRFALLAVVDTGCGMDDETKAEIFEPFFTTKTDGTGLGLATVHGIVKQSGGTIWVYSEPGQGTTFKIYLPLVESASVSSAPEVSGGGVSGESVLLVEDDAAVRDIVAQMLEADGYRVVTAGSGNEAVELADRRQGPIDLFLVDLVMPCERGREVAERLRRLRPEIPVLYMSGYTDDAVVREGVLDSRDAFIQKPFSSDELCRRVREQLDRRALAA
jgi:two-component system, cell cycle sensor histidine kinase and response regulator CckA